MDDKLKELRKKSLEGNNGKVKEHPMRITREEYLRKIKTYIALTAIVVASTIGGGKVLADKIHDSIVVGVTKNEYYNDLIGNNKEESERNWHPTDEGGNIWYDYAEIANDLKDLNADNEHEVEFDIGVSSLLDRLGEEDTNTVLRYTGYGGLDEYLEAKGYSDTDEYQKDMNKEIVLNSEIGKKRRELNSMRNESTINIDDEERTSGK